MNNMLTPFGATFDSGRNVLQMQQSFAQQQLGAIGATPSPGQIGVQSLEGMLNIGTYGEDESKLLRDLKSVPVFNLFHEFTTLKNYASSAPAAVGLGALPALNNANYQRGWAQVKFYADARMIPQQLLQIESAIGDLVGAWTRDSFMNLVGAVSHASYWGDSSINPDDMDGVKAQVKNQYPGNLIDARTAQLSPSIVEYMATQVRNQQGNATMNKLYGPPAAFTPMTINYNSNTRIVPNMWNGSAGNPFSQWDAQFGPARFRDDRFAEFDPFNGNAPIQSFTGATVPQGIPSAPTAAPSVSINTTDSNSMWTSTIKSNVPGAVATPAGGPTGSNYATAGQSTGYYAYCYSYINSAGQSIVSPITSVQTVQNGQSVTLSGPTSGVNPAPFAVRIFRQQLNSANDTPSYAGMQPIPEDVSVTVSSSGWTFTDTNSDIPGTYTMFYVNTSMSGAHFGRLGPMTKWDLAPINLAYWYVVTWYGMLIMPVPWWTIVIKNVSGLNVPSLNLAYPA